MHYWQTADFIRRGIQYLSAMDLESVADRKCLAWLFGYCAHVVTDFTVHPVLNLRVGPYELHKLQHRLSEINQDVYIFHRLGYGDIGAAEYIRRCGIGSCADETDQGRLDPTVRDLWCHCLFSGSMGRVQMKGGLPTPMRPPDPDAWFRHYVSMIDKFAEEGGRLPCLCRELAEAEGLVYPQLNEIDKTFIEGLKLPDGTTGDYDRLFEIARDNVMSTWDQLGAALVSGNPDAFTLPNGDLDTGLAENNQPIFWKYIA
jgi:hypothetical protein